MSQASLWQLAADIAKTSGEPALAADVDAHLERLHHQVGADIVQHWGFPARVVSAIRLHHASPETITAAGGGASLEGTVATVQLADALARTSVAGAKSDRESVQAHPSIATLSLYGDELDDLLGRSDVVLEAMRAVA